MQFFFAISSHNANVERIVSLIQSQWTKERKKLSVETMKGILTVQYNFREVLCSEFYTFLKSNESLMKNIRSTDKYSLVEEKDQEKASQVIIYYFHCRLFC